MVCNIIADAGSTKIDWAVTDAAGKEVSRIHTQGLNALLATVEEATEVARQLIGALPEGAEVNRVHYYGAGCATGQVNRRLAEILKQALNAAEVTVQSDLVGAARGLLQDKPGIICILGTGSNSGCYDGREITDRVPSLGYVLGDEGSGSAIGKRLISDVFKRRLPATIAMKLQEELQLDEATVLSKIYREAAPNRFLASLMPFVKRNINNPYIYSLVYTEFCAFLERNVSAYERNRSLPVSFCGSVAYNFAEALQQACERNGFNFGSISSSPIDGLIEYHSKNSQR